METNPFADLDIPEALQDSLERHLRHVAELVKNLRSVGLGEQQIEQSVSLIVESYRAELLRAMKSLAR